MKECSGADRAADAQGSVSASFASDPDGVRHEIKQSKPWGRRVAYFCQRLGRNKPALAGRLRSSDTKASRQTLIATTRITRQPMFCESRRIAW
jgi:hypothetical protein